MSSQTGGFLQKILFFAFDKYGRMFLIVDWYVNFDPGTKRTGYEIERQCSENKSLIENDQIKYEKSLII